MGTADDEAAMDKPLGLFLLPHGWLRPRFSITAPASRSITPVSAITRSDWQEENPRWDLQSEDDAAEKTYSGRFRVSLGKPGPLIYKIPFMGLYKLKVQLHYGLYRPVQKREEIVGNYKGKKKRFIDTSQTYL
jgi:hypothetical protein